MAHDLPPILDVGTLGESRRTLAIGDLVATETLHGPGTEIPRHAHARAGLNVVLEGRYGEGTPGAFHVHPPVTVIVKPAGEPHVNRFEGTGARCVLVEFEPEAVERFGEIGDALERPAARPAGPLAACGIQILRSLRGESPAVGIEEASLRILREASRRTRLTVERSRPRWLATVRERIHATAPERVRLDTLAEEAGVHPSHLSETFHRVFGTTISGYVETLRIERAVRDLVETERSIARIAIRCGFYDHGHFSRVFRRATGTTPSALRRAIRS